MAGHAAAAPALLGPNGCGRVLRPAGVPRRGDGGDGDGSEGGGGGAVRDLHGGVGRTTERGWSCIELRAAPLRTREGVRER